MPAATSDRLSRWTPAIFACALASFVLAQLLVALGVSWPMSADAAPATLVDVHLFTIGWLTLLIFGALFQFAPVISARKLLSQRLSLATLLLVELGLGAMVAGFLLLGNGAAAHLLPVGGGFVIVGALVGATNLAVPLARKRPLPLSAKFVLAGLAFLLLTIALGLAFALALTVPGLGSVLAPLLAAGVGYHALAGIGGWFTLTAIGVSYELLPMFMLAPHDRGIWGSLVLWTGVTGFAAALIAAPFAPGIAVVEQIGRVAVALAIALYLIDIVRLYRGRRRRQIELHNRVAVGAFACLAIALFVGIAAMARGALAEAAPTLVVLLLLGWLSGLGLTQLYKIVPFLAWLSRFGRRLGTGPVPRVQDLVNESAALPLFAAYFAAVAIAAVATWFAIAVVVRGAMVLALVATVLLMREYRRAWQGYYARSERQSSSPLPFSLRQKEAAHGRSHTPHA